MKEKVMPEKRVSVVMCTYNGGRFLKEQMDSILSQDYPLYEIIIQDDGSTDDTLEQLEEYRRLHPRLIQIFQNKTRLGFCRNFHQALLRASGDFVAISDQDDIWFSKKIRRQVESIGDYDLCFSDYYTDAQYHLPLTCRVRPRTDFEHLLFYDCTPGHAMLLRNDFIKGIKEWDYLIYYDWWLSVHALMGRGITKVDEPLNWHRHHEESATTHIYKPGRWEAVPHPTWQPYVLGYWHRLHLLRKRNYRHFYTYLSEHIDCQRYPVASRMAKLMLTRNPIGVLQLCLLCCIYYKRTYPGNPHGLSGRIHGFFYPFIAAYGNDLFKLERDRD